MNVDPLMPVLNELIHCYDKTFKVVSLIAVGPFSHVYKLVNLDNEYDLFAMKCEKNNTTER